MLHVYRLIVARVRGGDRKDANGGRLDPISRRLPISFEPTIIADSDRGAESDSGSSLVPGYSLTPQVKLLACIELACATGGVVAGINAPNAPLGWLVALGGVAVACGVGYAFRDRVPWASLDAVK